MSEVNKTMDEHLRKVMEFIEIEMTSGSSMADDLEAKAVTLTDDNVICVEFYDDSVLWLRPYMEVPSE